MDSKHIAESTTGIDAKVGRKLPSKIPTSIRLSAIASSILFEPTSKN